jgi:Domain of unknown function (DUF4440)
LKITLAIAVLLAASVASALHGTADEPAITQDELARRTQEMMDAIVPGNQEPFKKYYADDVLYADEKGRTMDKQALLKDVEPMPRGYSGSIKIVKPQSHIENDVAILSYEMDETEVVFGQQLSARYHQIDTWMRRKGQWQIVATQVMRYYEDPAQGKADVGKFPSYAGTYELGERKTEVTFEDAHLYEQRGSAAKVELIPEGSDVFFRKGVEGRWLFGYGDDGKVVSVIDRRNNEDIVWKKVK